MNPRWSVALAVFIILGGIFFRSVFSNAASTFIYLACLSLLVWQTLNYSKTNGAEKKKKLYIFSPARK